MNDILGIHIASAFLGIIGAYAVAVFLIQKPRSYTKLLIFRYILLAGLIGVIISGSILLTSSPASFLTSSRFTSNMTVMVVLVFVELFSFLKDTPRRRFLSVFSWTWIFSIAFIDPQLPYLYIIIPYIICAIAISFFRRNA